MKRDMNLLKNKAKKVPMGSVTIEYAKPDGNPADTDRTKQTVLKIIYDDFEKRQMHISGI